MTESNFLKGDTNIYFKQITFFEKKKKRFCKNHTYLFLKNIYIFFDLVLLHLNNHTSLHLYQKMTSSYWSAFINVCSENKIAPLFPDSLGTCYFWSISVQILSSGTHLRSSWIYSHSWYKSAAQCLQRPQSPALHEHFPYKTSPVSWQRWTYTS